MISDMEISISGKNSSIDAHIDAIIKLALIEDIGAGDITSNAIVDPRSTCGWKNQRETINGAIWNGCCQASI